MEQPKETSKDVELQLSELEERVDRLRALYEQYFMGYEKLEPTVPRKDVDRRFANLRKAHLRNTALRFRFNVITQKFNTYAMYWTRICRQIEEGTYKRHLVKAARRFGDDAVTARKGAVREAEESSMSIEVELGDFEDEGFDMDAVLREADAAAEAYGNAASDTIPPGSRTDPPPSLGLGSLRTEPTAFRPPGAELLRARSTTEPLRPIAPFPPFADDAAAPPPSVPSPSSTSFAMRGGRESVGSGPESRPMRAAALPPGTKPRILVRRADGPESTRTPTAALLESERHLPAAPRMESESQPKIRPRAPSFVDSESQPKIRPRAPSFVDSESQPKIRPRVGSIPDSEPTPAPMTTRTGAPPAMAGTMRSAQPYRPVQRPENAATPSGRPPIARPVSDRRIPVGEARPSLGPIATPPSPMKPQPLPTSTRMPTAPIARPSTQPFQAARPTTAVVERPGAPGDEEAPRSRRPPPPLPSAAAKKP